VDSEGNRYVAELFNGRVQKFRANVDADPAMPIANSCPRASQ